MVQSGEYTVCNSVAPTGLAASSVRRAAAGNTPTTCTGDCSNEPRCGADPDDEESRSPWEHPKNRNGTSHTTGVLEPFLIFFSPSLAFESRLAPNRPRPSDRVPFYRAPHGKR